MKKKKFSWFLFWQRCLDSVGLINPWVQLAFTGTLVIIGVVLIIAFSIFWLITIVA